jgi:hypothetical protein
MNSDFVGLTIHTTFLTYEIRTMFKSFTFCCYRRKDICIKWYGRPTLGLYLCCSWHSVFAWYFNYLVCQGMIWVGICTFEMVIVCNCMLPECIDAQGVYFIVPLSSSAVTEVLSDKNPTSLTFIDPCILIYSCCKANKMHLFSNYLFL